MTNYTLLPSALKTILTRHCVVTDDSKVKCDVIAVLRFVNV